MYLEISMYSSIRIILNSYISKGNIGDIFYTHELGGQVKTLRHASLTFLYVVVEEEHIKIGYNEHFNNYTLSNFKIV